AECQWLNDSDYRGQSVNWIECKETIRHADTHHSETKTFVHLTDLPITYEEATHHAPRPHPKVTEIA
ncbi:MAG: hypothetical protein GY947_11335, partial [Rhodobacteraceae bacterium]|nr:hypothetical protein [Paracoccaceae bacterium]